MRTVKVKLSPLVSNINLPTVIKTAIFPGEQTERLFIATQPGEIFYIENRAIKTFLDIRSKVIQLGTSSGGYDERGLLGLAFHPHFHYNGLFYIHYSVAGTQGPGVMKTKSFEPKSCDMKTLKLNWENREVEYDHIDTIEEWALTSNGSTKKKRTILSIRRPFANHNGVNTLTFSPESGMLVLSTGDGGSGYDPFNLSQNPMEIAGKIIEIDVNKQVFFDPSLIMSRFNELPASVQQTFFLMAIGLRNTPGVTFLRFYNQFIKYVGNVGQDMCESIFSFMQYKRIPVSLLLQQSDPKGMINFGWRAWEGDFPTSTSTKCQENTTQDKWSIAYYDEAVQTSVDRLRPLTSYFHHDPRKDKFEGTALTGVQVYMGESLPELTGSIVFTDLLQRGQTGNPPKGVLAFCKLRADRKLDDYQMIEMEDIFGSKSAYFVSLGSNLGQTSLYLGINGSMKVADHHQGAVFEIIP